jgi:putative transposase
MPRTARLDSADALHHVMARGIERRCIFRTDRDRHDWLGRLITCTQAGGASVFAWALLPNHVHLLLRSGHDGLSCLMQRLLGGYAREFNRRHCRHGHLFQNRFKSVVVEEDAYLLELVRYIHLNPVRAGLVPDVAALDRYPWTGHARLLGSITDGWQAVGYVLSLFGRQVGAARRAYHRFVEAGVAHGHRGDLDGGGLRRSCAGWEAVSTLSRGRERWAFDERILGSSAFVTQVQSRQPPRTEVVVRAERPAATLACLLQAVAQRMHVSVAELCSGAKRPAVVDGRALLSFLAVKEAGLRTAAVATALRVTPRAVARSLPVGARLAEEGDHSGTAGRADARSTASPRRLRQPS